MQMVYRNVSEPIRDWGVHEIYDFGAISPKRCGEILVNCKSMPDTNRPQFESIDSCDIFTVWVSHCVYLCTNRWHWWMQISSQSLRVYFCINHQSSTFADISHISSTRHISQYIYVGRCVCTKLWPMELVSARFRRCRKIVKSVCEIRKYYSDSIDPSASMAYASFNGPR